MGDIDREADFSVKQLKANLKATLQKSGVLGSVKAQIRQEFINSLSARERNASGKLGDLTISDRILFSTVFELLNNRGLMNSVSVFLAETGLDPKHSLLSTGEVGQLIKLNEISSVLQKLQNGRSLNQLDSSLVDPAMVESRKLSVLDLLVRFCTTSRETHKDVGTQMEGGGQSAREALEESLQELRSSFRASQTDAPAAATTIQERMIAYQRDCERRLQSEVAAQVAHMRETELTRVRLEEAAKARTEMDALRKRLELDYARRLQAAVDSEAALSQRMADQEHSAQRGLYAARQQMQREIDELRAREAAATRRLELEAQGVKMLELRLKESLSVVEMREADIARRERAVEEGRERAVEEARKEAIAQVQAQLEMLSRERSALLQERQGFLDQQAAHSALVEGARGVREQLRQARDELMAREEEVQALERQRQRTELQRRQEEDLVRKVDPAMAQQSMSEQVVALVRQNAALEVRLAECGDAFALQQRLEEEQKERRAAQGEVDALKERFLADQLSLQREREEADRVVSAERAKVASATVKVDELRQLLRDKTQALDTLRRQLTSQGEGGGSVASARDRARTAGRDRAGRVVSGNSSDRRALELLRESGRYADAAPELDERKAEQFTSALLDQVMRRLQASAVPPLHCPVMSGTPHPHLLGQPYFPHDPAGPSAAPSAATADVHAQQQQLERDEERRQAAEMAEALHKERLRAAALSAEVEQQRLATERAALQAERSRLEAEERARQQAFALYQLHTASAPQALPQRTETPEMPLSVQTSGEAAERTTTRPPSGKSAVSSTGSAYVDGSAGTSVAASEAPSATTSGTVRFSPLGATSSIPTTLSVSSFSPAVSEQSSRDSSRAGSVTAHEEAHPVHRHQMAELSESSDGSDSEPGSHGLSLEEVVEAQEDEEGASRAVAAAAALEQERKQREAEQLAELQERERQAQAERLKQQDLREQGEREAREGRERQQREAELEAEQQRQRNAAQNAAAERAAQEEARKQRDEAEAAEALARAAAAADAARNEAAAAAAIAEQEEARKEAEEKEAEEREAAEREAAEEQRRRDEDAAAIQEARMKVLERRRQRQQRDGVLSSSMPTSLQSAAAAGSSAAAARYQDGGSDDSGAADSSGGTAQQPSHSYSYSAASLLRSNMQPQVSTSLDSASATGLLGRAQPARNLFGSNNPSFQSLQDDSSSEGSGAQLEVGDVSDDREGDRSIW